MGVESKAARTERRQGVRQETGDSWAPEGQSESKDMETPLLTWRMEYA